MRAARRDLPALTRLWQACFGDTEAEVRAFWQALFDCTPVYLRRAPDGSPAAMLCALPAELVGDDGDAVPAAYLYAVCTAPGPARARPLPPAPAGGGAGPQKAGHPRGRARPGGGEPVRVLCTLRLPDRVHLPD